MPDPTCTSKGASAPLLQQQVRSRTCWFPAVYEATHAIPFGRVASYGQIGDRANVTARMAGKALRFCDATVPWWRVVGSDGTLRIARYDPALAHLQRERLEAEGVRLTDAGRVESRFFLDD